MKGCVLSFPKKSNLGMTKNYISIILAAKVYNSLLLHISQPKVEKILRKNQNGFWRNWSTTCQILTICLIIKRENVKKKSQSNNFVGKFFLGIWFYLPRLCTKNVKENGFTREKQTISCQNYQRCRLHRWSSTSSKYTCTSQVSAA